MTHISSKLLRNSRTAGVAEKTVIALERHTQRIRTAVESGEAARSMLVASWSRCIHSHGLDPTREQPRHVLTEAELKSATEPIESLLFSAETTLERLRTSTEGGGVCILFAGADGIPVRWYGQQADMDDLWDWGLCPGVDWSEKAGGTNGIGTCLVEKSPLSVHREQHFYERDIDISCAVAPIFNHSGLLAGALDITLYGTAATGIFSSFALAAVSEAARQIEISHFHYVFNTARILSVADRQCSGAGLLAVDADDVVVGATRSARLKFELTDEHLRDGVSAMDILGDRNDDLENAERGAIRRALARSSGNVTAAARALNVSRSTMKRKLRQYGVKRKA